LRDFFNCSLRIKNSSQTFFSSSNGYSLIRKIFGIKLDGSELTRKTLNTVYPELGKTLGEELLKPTIIYVKLIKNLIKKYNIAGLVHITGGGIIENPPRILPEGCAINIKKESWPIQPIFKLIQEKGNVSLKEMLRTFNYGIGLVAISEDDIKEGILIGEVVKGDKNVVLKD
jgi:phosphoribosylformylglycinamidine cyclo-ligase